MPTLLAILAAAAVTTGKGGLPGEYTRVKQKALHTSPTYQYTRHVAQTTISSNR